MLRQAYDSPPFGYINLVDRATEEVISDHPDIRFEKSQVLYIHELSDVDHADWAVFCLPYRKARLATDVRIYQTHFGPDFTEDPRPPEISLGVIKQTLALHPKECPLWKNFSSFSSSTEGLHESASVDCVAPA